jgi:trk system potassium uptake protein TrkA
MTQADVGVSRADVFIATTNEDEDNMVACQVAKHRFGVPRTIARVSNPKNEAIFKKLGVDCTIVVTNIILKHIQEEIPSHALVHLLTMGEEGTEILEIKVDEKSKAIGKAIKDLNIPWDSVLTLLMRNGQQPRVPTVDTVLKANDRLIALTTVESEEVLRNELLGG